MIHDPTRQGAAEELRRVRRQLDSLHQSLGELASMREAERHQLKLALAHEEDKLGAGAKDAPQVTVMRQQDRLAASDATQIAEGRERTANLIGLLAAVPFARAADATRAVAAEVEWLSGLVDRQTRRDELYRPASHRPEREYGRSPPSKLSRDEQLDSYRATAPVNHAAELYDDVDPEEAAAIERARRTAAQRAKEGLGAAQRLVSHETEAKPRKWMGKGPPPPGWNKAHAMPPMPKNFTPSKSLAAKPRPMAASPAALGPNAKSATPRKGSPGPRRMPSGATPAAKRPPSARELPTGARPPSPVPSLNTANLSSSRTNTTATSRSSTPSARTTGRSSPGGSFRSSPAASARSSVCGMSARSSSAGSSRGARTQLDFEGQRIQRMARAQAAKEAQTLEAAKRAAQRSKRVAGLIMNPQKLEEQKRQRAREAAAKMRHEREAAEEAKLAAEEARKAAESERKEHAAKAGAQARERLLQRKAEKLEEQRRLAELAVEQAEQAEVAAEEARRLKAEQRRLRNETSFFARATIDGIKG